MRDLKLEKTQLKNLIELTIAKIQDPDMPGKPEEKEKGVVFLQEFYQTLEESKLEFFPLSEILSLLVLEKQALETSLDFKLKKALKLNKISMEIKKSIQEEPEKLPLLIKIFDELVSK